MWSKRSAVALLNYACFILESQSEKWKLRFTSPNYLCCRFCSSNFHQITKFAPSQCWFSSQKQLCYYICQRQQFVYLYPPIRMNVLSPTVLVSICTMMTNHGEIMVDEWIDTHTKKEWQAKQNARFSLSKDMEQDVNFTIPRPENCWCAKLHLAGQQLPKLHKAQHQLQTKESSFQHNFLQPYHQPI